MTYLICILSWGVLCVRRVFMVKDMETIVQLAKHRGFVFPEVTSMVVYQILGITVL